MNELTFLEIDQIFSDKALEVFKKSGAEAAITDFAILLGGYVGNNSSYKRTGHYWTKTDDRNNDARIVDGIGTIHNGIVSNRVNGARPISTFHKISSISTNKKEFKVSNDGILEIEYGYYPRSTASKSMQVALERAYNYRVLDETGNTYTTDSRKYDEDNKKFLPQCHVEYEYNGKRYVRIIANTYYNTFTLSNRETYKRGDAVWISVEPVKWLVDEKTNIMMTEEIIFAGLQFNHTSDYSGDFKNTDIKRFMDTYLSKELFQNSNTININDNIDIESNKIIKELYSKGYTKEQITTIALDILNQMFKNTPTETDVKQKLKTPNK